MAEIVAVGGGPFVIALAGVGAEPVRCEGREAFASALRKTALRKDVHLVFVPEPMAMDAAEAVDAFRRRSKAALLALPLQPSDAHPTLDAVRRIIEQATGASLI